MNTKELVLSHAEKIIDAANISLNNVKTVTINEAWKILQLATAGIIQTLENIATDLSGQEKKIIAMEFISKFYDSVFLVVKLPVVPPLLEPIIHRYVKSILMIMVSASIDALVKIFKDTGIFIKKGATNG